MATQMSAARPACLRCLTRRAFFQSPVSAAAAVTSVSTVTVQARGKKTGLRRDSGVVVRLLQDIPQFGRSDTVLRVDRGRMRNLWYPRGMAEYVTVSRNYETDERDPFFGLDNPEVSQPEEPARMTVDLVEPRRAADILESLAPLVFRRKPINAADTKPSSPIFGSVSADDVAAALRAALQAAGDEAARVRVDGRDVRFLLVKESVDASADRVKALGRWEVEIAVRGGVAPVRKTVEVAVEAAAQAAVQE